MLKIQTHRIAWAIAVLLLTAGTAPATVSLGTEFTYQAQLKLDGGSLNDSADFEFSLWDDAGAGQPPVGGIQIGATQTVSDVTVVNGLFTVQLNAAGEFGPDAFSGDKRFIQIAVRSPHDPGNTDPFTTLGPRQPLTATPYALYALDSPSSFNLPLAVTIESDQDLLSLTNSMTGASGGSAFVGQASGFREGVLGINTATTGPTRGVAGTSASTEGAGVFGEATSPTGFSTGVIGRSSSTCGAGVFGDATAMTGATIGVLGESVSPDGRAVLGDAVSRTGFNTGVYGRTASTLGVGVRGEATATTGFPVGVHGSTASTSGTGVFGSATATTGTAIGVSGFTGSTSGRAVNGFSNTLTGTTIGVQGEVASSEGTGVIGKATRVLGTNFGVRGETASSAGVGVSGLATRTTGSTFGVVGACFSNEGTGVLGSVTSTNTLGTRVGVKGEFTSGKGVGVMGVAPVNSQPTRGVQGITGSNAGLFKTSVNFAAGVEGIATAMSGVTRGVRGQSDSKNGIGVEGVATHPGAIDVPFSIGVLGTSHHSNGTGVKGIASSTLLGAPNVGVHGEAFGEFGIAVFANAPSQTGFTMGVRAVADSPDGVGVRSSGGAIGVSASGSIAVAAFGDDIGVFADGAIAVNAIGGNIGVQAQGGQFAVVSNGALQVNGVAAITGNLDVGGTLTKGGGSFKIDHPLDPENRYLYHSFVESPDMMNIYNGNAVTDARGYATVELPEWFEALNRDFRYQLTVIGTFAQAIVAEKIRDGRFVIRTDKPNVEVSWQVTGIRQDAFANANRIPVEKDKPQDKRGRYLHPEAFGVSAELDIHPRAEPAASEKPAKLEAAKIDNRAIDSNEDRQTHAARS